MVEKWQCGEWRRFAHKKPSFCSSALLARLYTKAHVATRFRFRSRLWCLYLSYYFFFFAVAVAMLPAIRDLVPWNSVRSHIGRNTVVDGRPLCLFLSSTIRLGQWFSTEGEFLPKREFDLRRGELSIEEIYTHLFCNAILNSFYHHHGNLITSNVSCTALNNYKIIGLWKNVYTSPWIVNLRFILSI